METGAASAAFSTPTATSDDIYRRVLRRVRNLQADVLCFLTAFLTSIEHSAEIEIERLRTMKATSRSQDAKERIILKVKLSKPDLLASNGIPAAMSGLYEKS